MLQFVCNWQRSDILEDPSVEKMSKSSAGNFSRSCNSKGSSGIRGHKISVCIGEYKHNLWSSNHILHGTILQGNPWHSCSLIDPSDTQMSKDESGYNTYGIHKAQDPSMNLNHKSDLVYSCQHIGIFDCSSVDLRSKVGWTFVCNFEIEYTPQG